MTTALRLAQLCSVPFCHDLLHCVFVPRAYQLVRQAGFYAHHLLKTETLDQPSGFPHSSLSTYLQAEVLRYDTRKLFVATVAETVKKCAQQQAFGFPGKTADVYEPNRSALQSNADCFAGQRKYTPSLMSVFAHSYKTASLKRSEKF